MGASIDIIILLIILLIYYTYFGIRIYTKGQFTQGIVTSKWDERQETTHDDGSTTTT